jgi:hypothetical protein
MKTTDKNMVKRKKTDNKALFSLDHFIVCLFSFQHVFVCRFHLTILLSVVFVLPFYKDRKSNGQAKKDTIKWQTKTTENKIVK